MVVIIPPMVRSCVGGRKSRHLHPYRWHLHRQPQSASLRHKDKPSHLRRGDRIGTIRGREILHYRTIDPLIKHHTPLEIRNSYSPKGSTKMAHSSMAIPHMGQSKPWPHKGSKSLLYFEGHEMMGVSGIDARIFGALSQAGVSVSLVSQGSSERGTGIVTDSRETDKAIEALSRVRPRDSHGTHPPHQSIARPSRRALIGVPLSQFDKHGALVRHGIVPKLLNNAIPSRNTLCLLIAEEVPLALNVMHGELFDKDRKIHIAVVGHGTVGGALWIRLWHKERRYADARIRLGSLCGS